MANATMIMNIHPCAGKRSVADSHDAIITCVNILFQTGSVKISSARDTATSTQTATQIWVVSTAGSRAHEVSIPSIRPTPPVRGTGAVWRERELGRSMILRVLLLISHQIEARVATNEIRAVVARGNGRLAIMTPDYTCEPSFVGSAFKWNNLQNQSYLFCP